MCDDLFGAGVGRKRVYMSFEFKAGWLCEFLDEDLKTMLPKRVTVKDEKKIWEMAKRGNFTLNISGRQEIEQALRRKRGGIWLELTPEQYQKYKSLDSKKFIRHSIIGLQISIKEDLVTVRAAFLFLVSMFVVASASGQTQPVYLSCDLPAQNGAAVAHFDFTLV